MAKATTKTKTKTTERAVMVTTQHRSVFFGYTTDADDAPFVRLCAGCYVVFWLTTNLGVMGHANMGPVPGSYVGQHVDITIRDIPELALVSHQAGKLIDRPPWL